MVLVYLLTMTSQRNWCVFVEHHYSSNSFFVRNNMLKVFAPFFFCIWNQYNALLLNYIQPKVEKML